MDFTVKKLVRLFKVEIKDEIKFPITIDHFFNIISSLKDLRINSNFNIQKIGHSTMIFTFPNNNENEIEVNLSVSSGITVEIYKSIRKHIDDNDIDIDNESLPRVLGIICWDFNEKVTTEIVSKKEGTLGWELLLLELTIKVLEAVQNIVFKNKN